MSSPSGSFSCLSAPSHWFHSGARLASTCGEKCWRGAPIPSRSAFLGEVPLLCPQRAHRERESSGGCREPRPHALTLGLAQELGGLFSYFLERAEHSATWAGVSKHALGACCLPITGPDRRDSRSGRINEQASKQKQKQKKQSTLSQAASYMAGGNINSHSLPWHIIQQPVSKRFKRCVCSLTQQLAS